MPKVKPPAQPKGRITELSGFSMNRRVSLKLGPVWGARLLEDVVGGREIGIASSDIRHRVAEGLSIRYLVPDAVDMYIAEHHLYTR